MHSTRFSKRRLLLSSPLIGLAAPVIGATQTNTYPDRLIRLVVPSGPSTSFDILARTIAHQMGETWKVPTVVDNKPGASGNIGIAAVAKSPPDGYTLLVTANIIVQNRSLFDDIGFDPINDFAPISQLALAPMALVVNPEVPVKNVQELAALLKSTPDKYNYASPGNGTPHHLAMELLLLALDVNAKHIPYKTTASALPDLISGRVSFMFLPLPAAMPLMQDKRVNVLCAGGTQRAPATPDIISLAEATGIQDIDVDVWFGMYAPAGTPVNILEKLNTEVNTILARPDVKEKLAGLGLIVTGGTRQQLAELTRNDLERWADVVRKANIKPD